MDFPAPAPENEADFGVGIGRTMRLLCSSTPQNRHRVKILFYGQSITHGAWWKLVAADLKNRFPNADLIIENRALGGFAADVLIRPAEHDLYPFYPDLVIFHVYGSPESYEAIIRNLRSRTTSEVLLQSDHFTGPSEWHDGHSFEWLPQLAARYGCELVDVRGQWKRYLDENGLAPRELTTDGVHLNSQGNFLMAELVKRHLKVNPRAREDAAMVRDYLVGRDVKWRDGRLTLEFEGNRVDALCGTRGPTEGVAQVWINGRRPSQFPELYAITRPSGTPHIGWPGAIQIGHQTPLIVEKWTARLHHISADASAFEFEVFGSQTGADGKGNSAETFVSDSGRVVIEPRNWWFKNDCALSQQPTPEGTEISWTVEPHFVDDYRASKAEVVTTLAQGLSNGRHTLELVAQGAAPHLEAIRVYRPPVH